MNRPLSIALTRLSACAGLAVLLGACTVQSASSGQDGDDNEPKNAGENASRELRAQSQREVGQRLSQLVPAAVAPRTCEREQGGALVTLPDPCAGEGASRVLVRLGQGATCDTVLDLTTSPDIRVSRQFPDAPPTVRDRFCAFDAIDGDKAKVRALLTSLCAIESVSVAVHDCHVAPSAFAADGFVAKRAPMHVLTEKEDDTGDAAGPHSCDTCGVVDSDMLYVNIPLSMVPTEGATMIVRSLDIEVPDRAIQPPAGAQSFVIPQIGLPDAAPVRVYAPGQIPPPK